MKRFLVVAVLAVVLLLAMSMPALAIDEYNYEFGKSDHKVQLKYDLTGTYANYAGYLWGGNVLAGSVWTYQIHAKLAGADALAPQMFENSAGSIKLVNENGLTLEGQVREARTDLWWWTYPGTLSFAGELTYNDVGYDFLMMVAPDWVWLAAYPDDTQTSYWAHKSQARVFQTHSTNPFGPTQDVDWHFSHME